MGGWLMGSLSGDSEPSTVFSELLSGGENFLARIATLEREKKEHLEAYKQLQLGSDAVAARNEAYAMRAQAANELKAAQEKAASLISEAAKQANTHQATAARVKADADSYAAKVRSEAENHYKTKAQEAAAIKAEADKLQGNASKTAKELALKQAQLQQAQQDLEAKKQQHVAANDELQNKTALLRETLNRLA
jgi:hypothetical protein